MAITDTAGGSINSSTDATSYVTGSFTPAANNWLIAVGAVTDSAIAGTLTDSQSLGWDRLVDITWNSGAHRIFCFGAQNLAAASSMTVTYDCTGDGATGCVLFVRRIAGGRAAANRYRQVGSGTGAAATVPTVAMGSALNTNNAGFGFVFNVTNPATLTPPTSWTEINDGGHATPDMGFEYANRLTGETASSIAWGLVSASAWGAVVLEAYEAAQPGGIPRIMHHRNQIAGVS